MLFCVLLTWLKISSLIPKVMTNLCLLLQSFCLSLCIQDYKSGWSDNNEGCAQARLYNRRNSGDMQTRVRGPSINLTGLRSCQVYEDMLWNILFNWHVSCCTHTATDPPSTTRVLGPGRTARLCPSPRLCLQPQRGVCSAQLWSVWPRTQEGGWHYSPALPSDCLPHRSLRKSV